MSPREQIPADLPTGPPRFVLFVRREGETTGAEILNGAECTPTDRELELVGEAVPGRRSVLIRRGARAMNGGHLSTTMGIGSSRECRRCLRHEQKGGGFQLVGPDGPERRCLPCAVRHPPLLRRTLAIAAVVGSVLVAINQGDALFASTWSPALFWKVPLTYAVPFIVATWGALGASRVRR